MQFANHWRTSHEFHFVFDIPHSNTTDIQTERHPIGRRGANRLNFFSPSGITK
jgi:hypothetical protein